MFDLFWSECRRFRRTTLIFSAAHFGLQLFISRIVSVPDMAWEQQVVGLLCVMLSGMGLALYQIGSYTQPSRWLWLIHRPLSRLSIFSALSLAALAAIVVGIGLPVLLTVVGSHFLTEHPIDLRHYLMVPYVVLMALIAWMAGAAIMLSRRWFVVAIVFLPYLLMMHEGAAWRLLLMALACVLVMAYIAYGYFQPDRTAAPMGRLATFARATPLAIGFYFALIWASGLMFMVSQVMQGSHSLSPAVAVPAPGGDTEARRMNGGALLLRGLADSHDTRVQVWRSQIGRNAETLRPLRWAYPVHQQLSNRFTPNARSDTNHSQHTFSHDAMLLKVLDTETGNARGWVGIGGGVNQQAFPTVPLIANGYLLTRQSAFNLGKDGLPTLRATLPTDEQFGSFLLRFTDRYYALSNRRLIVYASDTQKPGAPYRELFSIPFPGPFSDLARVDIVERIADGTLVSFTGGFAMRRGQQGGTQTVFFVDNAGHAVVVAERALNHDYPMLYEHASWYLSPVLDYLTDLPGMLFMDGKAQDVHHTTGAQAARPPIVLATALLGSVLAVIGAWLWLPRREGKLLPSVAWLLACALLGLPGMAALMAMQASAARVVARMRPVTAELAA